MAVTLTVCWVGSAGSAGCGKDPAQQDDGVSGVAISDTEFGSEGASQTEEPGCGSNAECGTGQICLAGECTPNLPGGPCDDDSDCVDEELCEAGECVADGAETTNGMGCGNEVYLATAIPPNVLIVLDRSGSMDNEIGDQGSKWEIAQAAIAQVVADYDDEVLFGLMLYPGTDPDCDEGMSCGPGAIFVDIGVSAGATITNVLNDAHTCSLGTPTAETLENLQDYAGLEDHDRPNFILLITDGQSSCDNPVPMVADLYAQTPEIKTFVVGFGDGVDTEELNGMAQAGGTALPGDPLYYQADDSQALVDAFADIAGSVLSCTYLLDTVPPDPDKLYVYINDVEIPRDIPHANGWDYDAMTNMISFYGPACELLQSGDATDLQIVFGCPEAQ